MVRWCRGALEACWGGSCVGEKRGQELDRGPGVDIRSPRGPGHVKEMPDKQPAEQREPRKRPWGRAGTEDKGIVPQGAGWRRRVAASAPAQDPFPGHAPQGAPRRAQLEPQVSE